MPMRVAARRKPWLTTSLNGALRSAPRVRGMPNGKYISVSNRNDARIGEKVAQSVRNQAGLAYSDVILSECGATEAPASAAGVELSRVFSCRGVPALAHAIASARPDHRAVSGRGADRGVAAQPQGDVLTPVISPSLEEPQ